jgi:hypothetical protein
MLHNYEEQFLKFAHILHQAQWQHIYWTFMILLLWVDPYSNILGHMNPINILICTWSMIKHNNWVILTWIQIFLYYDKHRHQSQMNCDKCFASGFDRYAPLATFCESSESKIADHCRLKPCSLYIHAFTVLDIQCPILQIFDLILTLIR